MSTTLFDFVLLLLTRSAIVDGCPKIYKMVDENHSFCSPKRSIESFVPTAEEIELILRMHNEERAQVNSADMQKMVKSRGENPFLLTNLL